MSVVAFAPRPHPTANQPKKDLYEIGEIPPLGHVPKNMYAWVIRRERHGPPEQSMQLEVVPTHTEGCFLLKSSGSSVYGIKWNHMSFIASSLDSDRFR